MRCKYTLALGVVFALPIVLLGTRADADGLLKRHHHQQDNGAADQTVVRLPAQEIRVETTRPRVTVHQSVAPARFRGYYPAGQPFMAAPFVATIVAPGALQFGGATTAGSSTMDLAHALERQAADIAAARAHRQAIQAAEEAALQRAQAQIAKLSAGAADVKTTTTDSAQLKKAIEDLSGRLSAIEKLLIIHDDMLKKQHEEMLKKKTP